MSKYELCYFSEKGQKKVELLDFSEKDFIDCHNSVKRLNRALFVGDYFDIVNANLLELKKEIIDSESYSDNFFVNINRRMFNFLDTLYAYINFLEKNYNNEITIIKEKVYDNCFEYRVFYNLRTYMTHCEIAITKREYDVLKEKQRILINMDDIISYLEKKKNQRKFIKEIKTKKIKEINIKELVSQFEVVFEKMQEAIVELMLTNILEDLDKLKNSIVTNEDGGIMDTYLRENGKTDNQINTAYIYIRFKEKFMKRYEGKVFVSTL